MEDERKKILKKILKETIKQNRAEEKILKMIIKGKYGETIGLVTRVDRRIIGRLYEEYRSLEGKDDEK